jgi:hypothetical protein
MGDEMLLRMTLRQQSSKRTYAALTLLFAGSNIDVAAFNAGAPRARQLVHLALALSYTPVRRSKCLRTNGTREIRMMPTEKRHQIAGTSFGSDVSRPARMGPSSA